MPTITSSIIALLAAAPETPEPETVPVPVVTASEHARVAASTMPAHVTAARGARREGIPAGETAFERATFGAAPSSTAEPDPEPLPDRTRRDDSPRIDPYGPLPIIEMKNMAGLSVPTSLPTAFPRRPRKGLLGDQFNRRTRYTARGGGPVPEDQTWTFDWHGYLRAPMRVGYGERLGDQRPDGQGLNSIHAPLVPDEQYLSYQYTTHNPRDWAEIYMSYGNGIATGTISLQGFNFADASWKEVITQFGVAQAFVTLTPKLPARWARLRWKTGSFDNRYGASGRYDAGDLETYLFGRTHTMGEALLVDFLVKDFTISVEHGIGATRPDPQTANDARFTVLNHAHLGLSYQNKLRFTVHWLNAFAREAERINTPMPARGLADGRVDIVGPELRIDWGRAGFWYAGFSYIKADNVRSVSRAFEVIHSLGGGQFDFGLKGNYLSVLPNRLPNQGDGAGTGEIFTVLGQVEHSVQKILQGSKFYGQSWDVILKVYFMVNKVRGQDPDVDGILKAKVGTDLVYSALPWFGIGTRFTRVQPNSRIPEQSFSVLSPRLIFRTNFITHESIELQYSRYFYDQRVCPGISPPPLDDPTADQYGPYRCVQPPTAPVPPDGLGQGPDSTTEARGSIPRGSVLPDENVFLLRVSMWW